MKSVNCMYCGISTHVLNANVKRKIEGKVVTLKQAPVFYCTKCKETFVSKEAQQVLTFIKDQNLHTKKILFEYEQVVSDMIKK